MPVSQNHTPSKVALIIIFNHRFDRNLPELEKIYGKRFSNIYYLVPFYDGDRPDVIPVYGNSKYFQGYVAQAYSRFKKEQFDHYFFLGDDCILNPAINEDNYQEYFGLSKEASFIPDLISLHAVTTDKDANIWPPAGWPRIREAYEFSSEKVGLQARSELPEIAEAHRKFNNFGIEFQPLTHSQIWGDLNVSSSSFSSIREIVRFSRRLFRRLQHRRTGMTYTLPYPLIGSYSDIFIVSAADIEEFQRYCGVFSATELFVEIALPSALVLSATKIVTESNLRLKGKALWTPLDYATLNLERYASNFRSLAQDFPPYLYIHPIKLSKWKVDL